MIHRLSFSLVSLILMACGPSMPALNDAGTEPVEDGGWAPDAGVPSELFVLPDAEYVAMSPAGSFVVVLPNAVEHLRLDGTALWTTPLATVPRRVSLRDNLVYVLAAHATDVAQSFVYVLDMTTGAMVRSFAAPGAKEIKALDNSQLALVTHTDLYVIDATTGASRLTQRLSSGLIYGSFGFEYHDQHLYIPRAYPGGIDVVDLAGTSSMTTLPCFDWIHDVRKVEDGYFTAGHLVGLTFVSSRGDPERKINLGNLFVAHLFPADGHSIYALSYNVVSHVADDGRVMGQWTLPQAISRANNTSFNQWNDWILGQHAGRLAVFIQGRGIGWISGIPK